MKSVRKAYDFTLIALASHLRQWYIIHSMETNQAVSAESRTDEYVRINGKRVTIGSLTRAELDAYTADSIDKVARRIVKELSKKDLSDASLSQLGVCLGIAVDKSRLIRGASTQNVAVSGRVEALHRIQILGGRLDQALHGRDGSSVMPINNGSYCESGPDTPAIDVQAQVLDTDALALQRVAALAPAPPKKRRGRPPKVRPAP